VVVVDIDRRNDRTTAQRVDLLRDRFELFDGARREHDVGPGFGQRQCTRAPDAAPRAGDDRGAIVDTKPVENGQAPAASSASSIPCANVFHDNVAHLMRTGNFTTPRSASRSPSLMSGSTSIASPSPPSSADSWIDIIALNARVRARTSSTVLPFTAAD